MQEETNQENNQIIKSESEYILELLQEDRNTQTPVALSGFIAGMALTAFVNPIVGAIAFATITGGAIYSRLQRDGIKQKVITGELPAIALASSKDSIQEYKNLVGEEQFIIDLQRVDENTFTTAQPQVRDAIATEKIANAPLINPVEELSDFADKNVLILGISGDGKDFLVSNAVRHIKATQPQIKLFVIDPKGDKKESGYYQSVADKFEFAQCGELDDGQATMWFTQTFENWKALASETDEQWLLIITETTLIGGAFTRQKNNYLEEVLSKQFTTGSSYGKYTWVLAQNPNLAKLGMDSDARDQMHCFAVVHRKSAKKANKWHRVTATIKAKQLEMLCDTSPVKRAFYCPGTGEWHSMPKLENYSSFDRDNRKRLQPTNTTHTAPTKLQTQPDEIDRLLETLDKHPTGDTLPVALKAIDPNIPSDKIEAIAQIVKTEAPKRNKPYLLSKFSL